MVFEGVVELVDHGLEVEGVEGGEVGEEATERGGRGLRCDEGVGHCVHGC